MDLDTGRLEDCVDKRYNTTNLSLQLCEASNSSYLRTVIANLNIKYGNETTTREACGLVYSTHFPEVGVCWGPVWVCGGMCWVFVCVGVWLWGLWERESIARSALLSGYLGKSGHLPR